MKTRSNLRTRRALVTGGRGFIGSHLCERLLAEGLEVHATSRSVRDTAAGGVRWWQADLLDTTAVDVLLRQIRPDLVFHLSGHVTAGTEVENVAPTFHGLLHSTVNLLTVLSSGIGCDRIVLTGSLTEPPSGQVDTPPSSPYSAAKWAGVAYGRMFHALYKTPVVITRLYMGYGPRQRSTKLIPYAITSLAQGRAPALTSGNWAADWIYIDDLVEGMLRAAVVPGLEGKTVDLGTGSLTSIRDVVQQLVEIMKPNAQPRFGVLPDRIDENLRIANVDTTCEQLGWTPSIALDDGLLRTVRWFTAAAGTNGTAVVV